MPKIAVVLDMDKDDLDRATSSSGTFDMKLCSSYEEAVELCKESLEDGLSAAMIVDIQPFALFTPQIGHSVEELREVKESGEEKEKVSA